MRHTLDVHIQLADRYHDLYCKANALKLEIVGIGESLDERYFTLSNEKKDFLDWLTDTEMT